MRSQNKREEVRERRVSRTKEENYGEEKDGKGKSKKMELREVINVEAGGQDRAKYQVILRECNQGRKRQGRSERGKERKDGSEDGEEAKGKQEERETEEKTKTVRKKSKNRSMGEKRREEMHERKDRSQDGQEAKGKPEGRETEGKTKGEQEKKTKIEVWEGRKGKKCMKERNRWQPRVSSAKRKKGRWNASEE